MLTKLCTNVVPKFIYYIIDGFENIILASFFRQNPFTSAMWNGENPSTVYQPTSSCAPRVELYKWIQRTLSRSLSWWQIFIFFVVNRGGNGYEARQTLKEQTKMPRFMLEGLRPCTIFCFAFTTFPLVSSSVSSKQLLCFVHGQGQKREKNIQQRPLSSFIIISLY